MHRSTTANARKAKKCARVRSKKELGKISLTFQEAKLRIKMLDSQGNKSFNLFQNSQTRNHLL